MLVNEKMTPRNDRPASQRCVDNRHQCVDSVRASGHGVRMTTASGGARKLTKSQEARLRACDSAAQESLRALRYELLTELRAQGWTLPELGALLGCSRQRVHLLLRGR